MFLPGEGDTGRKMTWPLGRAAVINGNRVENMRVLKYSLSPQMVNYSLIITEFYWPVFKVELMLLPSFVNQFPLLISDWWFWWWCCKEGVVTWFLPEYHMFNRKQLFMMNILNNTLEINKYHSKVNLKKKRK